MQGRWSSHAGVDAMHDRDARYFDHDADVGIIGRGDSVEAALEDAARAMFDLMVDTTAVRPEREVTVAFTEEDPEFALVAWLNGLLAAARADGLALGRFELRHADSHWDGRAWGEPWSDHLEPGVEVKGATLTMLAVERTGGGWEARCVVDV